MSKTLFPLPDDLDLESDLPVDDWSRFAPLATLSVEECMDRLLRPEAESFTLAELMALSNLSRAEAAWVQTRWAQIPTPRRQQVIRTLIGEAEENLDLYLGPLLRIVLGDEESEIRCLAIAGLWEESGPDLAAIFVQMLHNDPETAVRAAAAQALGLFVLAGEVGELDAALSSRVEEALRAVLQSDEEQAPVQAAALASIAYASEMDLRQLIEDAYYSTLAEVRVGALQAMGRSADVHWRTIVRAELVNPDPAMRAEAARACGELEVKSALRGLLLLLEDDELAVRVAAIQALGRIGGQEARAALRIMADSEIPEEIDAADLALEEMLFYADGGDIPLLDDAAEEEGEDDWDLWDEDDEDDEESDADGYGADEDEDPQ